MRNTFVLIFLSHITFTVLCNKINLENEDISPLYETSCAKLRTGQYFCHTPEINPATQQPRGCTPKNTALTTCTAAEGIVCLETKNATFEKQVPCKWTNGYSYETSLLLSIFLGMFGVDRFYLGYHAMGLFKLCTLGCFFIGQLVDIILIATQTVGPADGSHYIVSYFGPKVSRFTADNDTYRLPQPDWGEL